MATAGCKPKHAVVSLDEVGRMYEMLDVAAKTTLREVEGASLAEGAEKPPPENWQAEPDPPRPLGSPAMTTPDPTALHYGGE